MNSSCLLTMTFPITEKKRFSYQNNIKYFSLKTKNDYWRSSEKYDLNTKNKSPENSKSKRNFFKDSQNEVYQNEDNPLKSNQKQQEEDKPINGNPESFRKSSSKSDIKNDDSKPKVSSFNIHNNDNGKPKNCQKLNEVFLKQLDQGVELDEDDCKLENIYKNYYEVTSKLDPIDCDKIIILADNVGSIFIIVLDLLMPLIQHLSKKWEHFCKVNLESKNNKVLDLLEEVEQIENIEVDKKRCHIVLNKQVFKQLTRQHHQCLEKTTRNFKIKKMNIKTVNFESFKVSEEEIVEIKVKKFGTKILMFLMDIRLQLKVYDLSMIIKDILQPEKILMSNDMKEEKYMTCNFDIASNTIYRWDLYQFYQKRQSENSVITRRFLEQKFNFRFIDNVLTSKFIDKELLEIEEDPIKKKSTINDRDYIKVIIKPEEEEFGGQGKTKKILVKQDEMKLTGIKRKNSEDDQHFLLKANCEYRVQKNLQRNPLAKNICKKFDTFDDAYKSLQKNF